MSFYGDGPKNDEMNELLDEILYFLKSYSDGDLLQIVTDAIKLHNGEF